MVEYGCEKQISERSKLAATKCIGLPIGVLLKVKLNHRECMVWSFSIHGRKSNLSLLTGKRCRE
ncbi:DnaJ (Hsp40) [Porites harrisoni]